MTGIPLSASKIKTHESCPKQYELRYIQRKEATKAPNGYLALGTWVHESIENVLREMPDERNESALLTHFKQEFVRLEDDGEIDTTYVDEDQRDRGMTCIETAARFVSKQDCMIRDLEAKTNYYVEVPDIERFMLGYIDVTTDSEVWDWKTGTIRQETPVEEVIQGSVYMAGYKDLYGELPESIKFVYLKEEKVRDVKPTQSNWNRMLHYARRLMDDERSGNFRADPDDSKCYWCDYSAWCPAAKTSPGQLTQALEENPALWDAF